MQRPYVVIHGFRDSHVWEGFAKEVGRLDAATSTSIGVQVKPLFSEVPILPSPFESPELS